MTERQKTFDDHIIDLLDEMIAERAEKEEAPKPPKKSKCPFAHLFDDHLKTGRRIEIDL